MKCWAAVVGVFAGFRAGRRWWECLQDSGLDGGGEGGGGRAGLSCIAGVMR
jgi:hypothetical protein